MKLFNFETNRLETVLENEVVPAVLSGRYGLQKGESISVVLDSGRKGSVPAEKAFSAFQGGARLYTREEQEKDAQRARANTTSGMLLGTAASLARGATLGLSDALLTAGDSPESNDRRSFLNAFKDEHPNASLSFDILGAVVPAFFTGGASVGARGAAKTALSFTPAGLAARAGRATETSIARGIGAPLSVGSRVAPRVAGSAVEGAAFATGGVLSERTLGDLELTAESLVGGLTFGAIVGGAFGGALALPGALSQKAYTAAKESSENLFNSTRAKAQEFADKASKATGKNAEALKSEGLNFAKKFDDEFLAEARIPNPKSKYFDASDISPFNSTERMVATTGTLSKEEARYYLKNITRVKDAPNVPRYLDIVEDAAKRVDKTISALGKQLDDEIIGKSTSVFKLEDFNAKLNQMLRERDRLGITSKRASSDVRFIKGVRNDLINKHVALEGKTVPLSSVREELKSIRSRMPARESLGKKAGETVERAMIEMDTFLNAQIKADPQIGAQATLVLDELSKLIKTRDVVRKMTKRQKPEGIVRILEKEFSGIELPRFNSSGVPNDVQALTDLSLFVNFGGRPTSLKTLFKESALREKLLLNGSLARASGEEAQIQLTKAIAGSVLGAGLVAAAGRVGAIREIGKVARGKLFEKLTDPDQNIVKSAYLRLKGLEDFKIKMEKKIRDGATNFKGASLGGSAIRTPRVLGPVTPIKILQNFSFRNDHQEKKNETAEDAVARISLELSSSMNSPERFSDNLNKAFEPINDVAPETGFLAIQTTMRAISFLNRVAPKNPYAGDVVEMSYTPSDIEVQKFSQYLMAVQDPFSVIDDFSLGLMTSEQALVLKEVYPSILAYMQETVLDEISDEKNNISLDSQVQLSLLLGISVSGLMSPTFINSMQTMDAGAESGQSAGGAPGDLRFQGLDKLNRSESNQTEIERIGRGIQ